MIKMKRKKLSEPDLRHRFLTKVWGIIDFYSPDKCWIWPYCSDKNGYGQIHSGITKSYVHRLSYKIYKGDIPKEYCVLHQCDNPPCFNPFHLYLGTPADNMLDAAKKNRLKSKITTDMAISLKHEYKYNNITKRELAYKYGLSWSHVHKIIIGERWAHLNDEPKEALNQLDQTKGKNNDT